MLHESSIPSILLARPFFFINLLEGPFWVQIFPNVYTTSLGCTNLIGIAPRQNKLIS